MKGVVTRPSAVIGPAYEEVSKAYIRAVHSVLAGQRGASEAAAELEKATNPKSRGSVADDPRRYTNPVLAHSCMIPYSQGLANVGKRFE